MFIDVIDNKAFVVLSFYCYHVHYADASSDCGPGQTGGVLRNIYIYIYIYIYILCI